MKRRAEEGAKKRFYRQINATRFTWPGIVILLLLCLVLGSVALSSITKYRDSKVADLQYVAAIFDTSLPQATATVTGHDIETSGRHRWAKRSTYCAEFTVTREEVRIVGGPSGTFTYGGSVALKVRKYLLEKLSP